jgi:hypothetical protein
MNIIISFQVLDFCDWRNDLLNMDQCGHYQPLSRRNEFAMINDYDKLENPSNNYMVDIKYYGLHKILLYG